MSYKIASYVSIIFFAILGVFFYNASLSFPERISGDVIGPGYFPKIVSMLLIAVSIISLLSTKKKVDCYIDLPNLRYIVLTVVITCTFVAVWENMLQFYIPASLFLAVLIYLYDQGKHCLKKLLASSVISLAITAVFYIVFEILLQIPMVG